MNHHRKTICKYKSHKTESCAFCDISTISNAIYEDKFVYIVPNLTQYDLWELHDVEDHLLLIPKRHILTLAELSDKERLAVIGQAALYETKGCGVYARGVGFIKRSMKHQHTHLIKISNKKPKIAVFLQSPYYLFKKIKRSGASHNHQLIINP
jgi:diadenosine tetraphosphate (Ap4A) HIT family hydrolase